MASACHRVATAGPVLVALLLLAATGSPSSALAADEADAVPYSRRGADTCLGCHEDSYRVLQIFRTKHGQRGDPRTPFGEGGLQCEACHGPGGLHTGLQPRGEPRPSMPYWGHDSEASVDELNGVCLNCHETHMGLKWAGSAHDIEGIECASCHKVHQAHDPMLRSETSSEVCGTCHLQQKVDSHKPYGHPIELKRFGCTDCHSPHGSSNEHMLVRNTTNETCYQCHQDKRGPHLWEHAPVVEDCSHCHQPHGSINPALLTRRPPLLCQSCHSQAGHPSIPHTTAGLPAGNPSAMLLNGSCLNCHSQVHGSNHPSGANLMR